MHTELMVGGAHPTLFLRVFSFLGLVNSERLRPGLYG
jgi:hypothetical protein